jgi:CheY-like chemotaxis protein
LVEDDADDVIITREALEEGDVLTRLNVVGDRVEAIDYLRRTGRYDDAVRPDLVLLDLNPPKRDGLGWERWWRGVLDCDRAGI